MSAKVEAARVLAAAHAETKAAEVKAGAHRATLLKASEVEAARVLAVAQAAAKALCHHARQTARPGACLATTAEPAPRQATNDVGVVTRTRDYSLEPEQPAESGDVVVSFEAAVAGGSMGARSEAEPPEAGGGQSILTPAPYLAWTPAPDARDAPGQSEMKLLAAQVLPPAWTRGDSDGDSRDIEEHPGSLADDDADYDDHYGDESRETHHETAPYWAVIKASYFLGGHVVLALGPGKRPYLGLQQVMHLDGSTYHDPEGHLEWTDWPNVPPAPMRPFLRALPELAGQPWLLELVAGLPPGDSEDANHADPDY